MFKKNKNLDIKKQFNNNTEFNNSFNYVSNHLKFKDNKVDFEKLFRPIINFILKHNKKQFYQNNYEYKYFFHIKGGANIKYKAEKQKINMDNLTSDIDIDIVPLENIPNMKITIINNLKESLQKEFHNYLVSIEYHLISISIVIGGIKILDIWFIDEYERISNVFTKTITNYYNNVYNYYERITDYYQNNDTLENLEKITFLSIDLEFEVTINLFNYYENIFKNKKNKKNINELYHKIKRYNKKIEYIKNLLNYKI